MSKDTEQNRQLPIVEQLLLPDGIESMVKSGRVPGFMGASSRGRSMGSFLLIPPEGTQWGDTFKRGASGQGHGDMGVVEFVSPEGQSRGLAQLEFVSADVRRQLEPRIDAAINEVSASRNPQ